MIIRPPDITDEMGKHWEQPSKDEMIFYEDHVVMTLRSQEKLGTYDFSLPSGTYVGKMWKTKWLNYFNRYKLCWYHEIIGKEISIKRLPIVIGDVNQNKVYYLQNVTAGYIGNSPLFWEKTGSGYTPNLDIAKLFSKKEAEEIIQTTSSSHKFVMWHRDECLEASYRTVDSQLLKKVPF